MAAFAVPSFSPPVPLLLLLAVAVFLIFPKGAASLSSREYECLQRVLRTHGYNGFCDAMAASDLQFDILKLPPDASFTIFAPSDASLFALDTASSYSYNDTLRLHVVPFRLSLSDLRAISSGSILPTLLPYTALRVTTDPLQVAGVDVALPGLFYSRGVAVHGLGGVISYGSHLQASAPVASGGAVAPSPVEFHYRRFLGEKNKNSTSDPLIMTKKRALCIAVGIGFAAGGAILYWLLHWAGLIADRACTKYWGDLKRKKELQEADEMENIKEVKLMIKEWGASRVRALVEEAEIAKKERANKLEAEKAERVAIALAALQLPRANQNPLHRRNPSF